MTSDFRRGVSAAAHVASEYNRATTHPYRLDDCIAGKLNVGRLKPRRNKDRLRDPADAWICGLALGLAEMHRRLLGGSDSSGVQAVARQCGLTLAVARGAGVSSFDRRELRKAGVK